MFMYVLMHVKRYIFLYLTNMSICYKKNKIMAIHRERTHFFMIFFFALNSHLPPPPSRMQYL